MSLENSESKPPGILSRVSRIWRQLLGIIFPLVLLPLVFIHDDEVTDEGRKSTKFRAAYTILLVALYWMFEVMPLAVTSLLPIVLFPFLGVLDTEEVAPTYFKETNVMFFGGLVLALSVEYCNLHRRIALKVMTIVGSEPIRLLFGVMATSMFLSMWMSNTACTAMMLPILIAVLGEISGTQSASSEDGPHDSSRATTPTPLSRKNSDVRRFSISHPPTDKDDEPLSSVTVADSDTNLVQRSASTDKILQEQARQENIKKMFMFGVAYASNIGGTATITGTGPNLVFQAEIKKIDVGQGGKYLDMTFANWMGLNVPAAVLNTLLTFVYLIVAFYGIPNWRDWPLIGRKNKSKEKIQAIEDEKEKHKRADKMIKEEYEKLGPMSFHEIGVFFIFASVVLLWVFRDPKFMKGWNNVLEDADIGDSTAAILGIVVMFLVPKDLTFFTGTPKKGQAYEALLDWKFVQHHLSWGVVLLLGGGFALSEGADKSGLSDWIGHQLTGLEDLPRPVILIVVMILTAALTEVCSNVATANVLLPILLQLSKTINIHPLYLSVPATISCSFAFMLPVATPPNALVFSAGNLRITDMVKTGLFLNIGCVVVYFLVQISLGELMFNYSDYAYPPDDNSTTTAVYF